MDELTDRQVDMVGIMGAMFIELHRGVHSKESDCQRCRLASELIEIAAVELMGRGVGPGEFVDQDDKETLVSMMSKENLLSAALRSSSTL